MSEYGAYVVSVTLRLEDVTAGIAHRFFERGRDLDASIEGVLYTATIDAVHEEITREQTT